MPEVQQSPSEDSLKFSASRSQTSNSSSDKALSTHMGSLRQDSAAELDRPTRMKSMPKLQTNLATRSSSHTLNTYGPIVQSPSNLSLIPDDEDHEIIVGRTEEDDDDLAAPAPTVKHGKQQDLIARQRKRTSIQSFAAVRGTSPDTLRNISPIVRSHPDSFIGPQPSVLSSQLAGSKLNPHQLQREVLPDEIDEPNSQLSKHSPPASYVPSGAPAGLSSVHTSRSSSPVKIGSRQRSSSRLSALNALEGNSPGGFSNSPPKRIRGGRSRRSSVQTERALNLRHSQYSMSSMSGAMATLYDNHERDFKHRQSVTQDDLVARGLENMDFTALR